MNSSVKVRGTNPINVKAPAVGQSRRYFLAFFRRAKTRTLGGVGGWGGGGSPLSTLAVLVWNRVWFSKELRERMNVFIVSIPNE